MTLCRRIVISGWEPHLTDLSLFQWTFHFPLNLSFTIVLVAIFLFIIPSNNVINKWMAVPSFAKKIHTVLVEFIALDRLKRILVMIAGLLQGTPFTTLHPRLFHIMSFFGHPGLVKRDFFHCRQAQSVPREYHTQCYIVEVQTLVEFNPNILVRCFQRMHFIKKMSSMNLQLGVTQVVY